MEKIIQIQQSPKKEMSLRQRIVELERRILQSVQMDNWSVEPRSTDEKKF